jgi:iron complex outermembrane receptor protein
MHRQHAATAIGRLSIIGMSLAAIGMPAYADETSDAAEQKTTALETVVVTAQKRTQNVKEVPIAMTVVNAAQLERAGVKDIGDLAKTAASLEFGDQKAGGAGNSASIRGIGSAVFTMSAESSVGVVVDGVPQGGTASGLMLDLGRVEVLRGPQGTLFGKNASAGVLNLSTQAPMIGESGGNAALEYKGSKGGALRGTVNLPINDISALRVSGLAEKSEGVYHNVYTGKDSVTDKGGLRARYLLKPNSDVVLNLITDVSRNNAREAVFFAPMVAYASNAAGNHQPLAEFAACGVTVSKTNNQICSDALEKEVTEVRGISGQIDWSLANGATLTSITAVRKRETGPNSAAVDMSEGYDKVRNAPENTATKQVSQEVRIASAPKQPVEYVGGFFYAKLDNDKDSTTTISPNPVLPSPPVPRSIATHTISAASMTTKALFGQATFRVSEAASIIAGLRYTRDEVDSSQRQTSVVAFDGFALPAVVKNSGGNARETNVSGKLGWQYAVSKDVNTYASLSRGYKGPQIDDSTLRDAASVSGTYGAYTVRPEIPTSVEVGAKLALLDRRLDVDVALFRTSIKDFQEQNCLLSSVGALACIPLNVPKVVSKGMELDVRARPVPELQVGLSVAAILGTEYPDGFMFDGSNVGGQRLMYSPKMKAALNAEYSWSLPGDYELKLGGDAVYKSAVRYCNSLDANCTFKAHTITSVRLALRSPDDKWGVSAYVRNLGDERVPNAIIYPLPGKGAGSGFAYALGENSFRAAGVIVDVKF